MDCPKCRLVNPPSAVRCDCGYNFSTGQVEALPRVASATANEEDVSTPLQTMAGIVFCLMLVRCLMAAERSPGMIPVLIGYTSVLGGLIWAVYKKSNAARIALMILAFPLGLFFMNKDSVRRHCTGG